MGRTNVQRPRAEAEPARRGPKAPLPASSTFLPELGGVFERDAVTLNRQQNHCRLCLERDTDGALAIPEVLGTGVP